MSIYITTGNRVIGVDPHQTVPDGAVPVPDTFTNVQYPYLTLVNGVVTYTEPVNSVDDQITLNVNAVVAFLNQTAKQYGYDDIKTAIGWASDTPYVPLPTNTAAVNAALINEEKYRREGIAFKAWRSKCFSIIDAYNVEMKAGTQPIINATAAVNKVPPFVAPV